jgi:hypothetical protein
MAFTDKFGIWTTSLAAILTLAGALINTVRALRMPAFHLTAVYTMILLIVMVALVGPAVIGALRTRNRRSVVFATFLLVAVAQLFVQIAQHHWWWWFGRLTHS